MMSQEVVLIIIKLFVWKILVHTRKFDKAKIKPNKSDTTRKNTNTKNEPMFFLEITR